MTAPVIDRLREHALIGDAPDEELRWLADRGELRHYPGGEVIAATGERVEGLYIVLSGRFEIHIERAHGRRKVMEWRGGDVTGFIPYSRMQATPGDVRAIEPTDALTIPRELVPELPAACPTVTTSLVHVMIDRARQFTSADLQDQKALALGKVAAGLAHELNNPASALIRSAKTLTETLDTVHRMPSDPAAMTPEAVAAADRLYALCREREPIAWDPVERSDREQAIEEWIEAAGSDGTVAAVLAESPLALDELFDLGESIEGPGAVAAVCRMAQSMIAGRLAEEIEAGASRVYHLVSAVKRFTHMDQAMVLGPVHLDAGLRDAATLVGEKARAAGVEIDLALADDVPPVVGVVEDLNQMWHHLLDNAVDAAAPDGEVSVTCSTNGDRVVVAITDDGPGIPDEIRDRIFDPFFTTKPVGAGAGLGLEVVRRVLEQHRGDIEVTSAPGRTTFHVALPTEADG